ncbi:MAG TPA: hypothetical protein VLL52_05555 [Anaerolineae bacterium]|nr:hypothetical protein [Anaerolineae bacterium]
MSYSGVFLVKAWQNAKDKRFVTFIQTVALINPLSAVVVIMLIMMAPDYFLMSCCFVFVGMNLFAILWGQLVYYAYLDVLYKDFLIEYDHMEGVIGQILAQNGLSVTKSVRKFFRRGSQFEVSDEKVVIELFPRTLAQYRGQPRVVGTRVMFTGVGADNLSLVRQLQKRIDEVCDR